MKMYPEEQVALRLTSALIIAKPELLTTEDLDERDEVIAAALELYSNVSDQIERRFDKSMFGPKD